MIITNKYNLPKPAYDKIVETNQPPNAGEIRVTTLIEAPFKRWLRTQNESTLTVDASDFIWAFFGQVLHYSLSETDAENALTEERLKVKVNGIVVTGQSDLYCNKTLTDYKTTSYRYANELRPKWIEQLNVYAWLWRKMGFEVERLRICMFLRDWMVRMRYEEGQPNVQYCEHEVPLWTFEKQQAYVVHRVLLHIHEQRQICTPEEMWEKPTTFAIMQKGKVKAIKASYKDNGEKKSMLTREKAEELMAEINKPNLSIEERPGARACCKDYCLVRSVCPNNEYRTSREDIYDARYKK